MVTSRIPERTEKLPRLAYDAYEMLDKVKRMIHDKVEPLEKLTPVHEERLDSVQNGLLETNAKLAKFDNNMQRLDQILAFQRRLERDVKQQGA